MQQSLHDAWWRLATQRHPRSVFDFLVTAGLSTAACVYRAGLAMRNAAYDRQGFDPLRLGCPVISVGNLTVGGTGKTAFVELLTRKLVAQGRRVIILSRGYGGRSQDYWLKCEQGRLWVDGKEAMRGESLADEPQLLARHLEGVPVVVGSRRSRTGQWATHRLGADVLILDDGFQHRSLHRDCDVVLVNARMPLEGWPLLPRGPMREPLHALKRAQVVILTKADEVFEKAEVLREQWCRYNPRAIWISAAHEPMGLFEAFTGMHHSLERLADRRVGLLSSIGDPQGFEATVCKLQAVISWHRAFSDHHRYQAEDWAVVIAQGQKQPVEVLLTTEKDWVRLQPVVQVPVPFPLWILRVQMKILSGEQALDDRLACLCAR